MSLSQLGIQQGRLVKEKTTGMICRIEGSIPGSSRIYRLTIVKEGKFSEKGTLSVHEDVLRNDFELYKG